jgi:hypothetical protein
MITIDTAWFIGGLTFIICISVICGYMVGMWDSDRHLFRFKTAPIYFDSMLADTVPMTRKEPDHEHDFSVVMRGGRTLHCAVAGCNAVSTIERAQYPD